MKNRKEYSLALILFALSMLLKICSIVALCSVHEHHDELHTHEHIEVTLKTDSKEGKDNENP